MPLLGWFRTVDTRLRRKRRAEGKRSESLDRRSSQRICSDLWALQKRRQTLGRWYRITCVDTWKVGVSCQVHISLNRLIEPGSALVAMNNPKAFARWSACARDGRDAEDEDRENGQETPVHFRARHDGTTRSTSRQSRLLWRGRRVLHVAAEGSLNKSNGRTTDG